MSSVLNDILDFGQLQHGPTVGPGDTSSTPLTPSRHQDPSGVGDDDDDEDDDDDSDSGGSQAGDNGQEPSSPAGTLGSPNPIAAFTINTARNLQLTADGENSLLQFSQLDARSALIYQQATLIKLSETYSRRESTTTTRGSEASDQLVITNEIKNIIDYRIRLIILSPKLSRYRSLDKGLKTGPGAVLLEWLRSDSGINKKYFEGAPYKALRSRVKSSCRYARAEVKDVIRHSVENRSHITVLLRELVRCLEKWVKGDLRTPLTLAVRLAFLREVYQKDSTKSFWTTVDETLADVRHKEASGNGLTASQILVKCLDADEQRYPPATASAAARTALANVWLSGTQSSMDTFVSNSESISE